MKVKDLLKSPKNWSQDAFARQSNGQESYVDEKASVRFCLLGAIMKCYKGASYQIVCKHVINYIREQDVEVSSVGSIVAFNDHETTKFKDIKKLIIELDI